MHGASGGMKVQQNETHCGYCLVGISQAITLSLQLPQELIRGCPGCVFFREKLDELRVPRS